MPYLNRHIQFQHTLESFLYYYKNRKDYEVIVIEEYKNVINERAHNLLVDLVSKYSEFIDIKHIEHTEDNCYNPTPLFNMGSNISTGKFLIITNPECLHPSDVLKEFDSEFDKNENVYIVCACRNVTPSTLEYISSSEIHKVILRTWYQHTQHNNRAFHWCSAISKLNYDKIGGFDEKFKYGIGFDDNDFRDTVLQSEIPFVFRDDIVIFHTNHESINQVTGLIGQESRRLFFINKEYYLTKRAKRNIAIPFGD